MSSSIDYLRKLLGTMQGSFEYDMLARRGSKDLARSQELTFLKAREEFELEWNNTFSGKKLTYSSQKENKEHNFLVRGIQWKGRDGKHTIMVENTLPLSEVLYQNIPSFLTFGNLHVDPKSKDIDFSRKLSREYLQTHEFHPTGTTLDVFKDLKAYHN